MARNDEGRILELERVAAAQLRYDEVVKSFVGAGEPELANQFRWIAGQLGQMSNKTPVERRRVRREVSKRIKKLGDVVREKHIQYNLSSFRCIDQHDECVRNRKKQKKSPYLCFLALFICLANSMKVLLTAMAAAAKAGGLL